jgi:hypothetical protein
MEAANTGAVVEQTQTPAGTRPSLSTAQAAVATGSTTKKRLAETETVAQMEISQDQNLPII